MPTRGDHSTKKVKNLNSTVIATSSNNNLDSVCETLYIKYLQALYMNKHTEETVKGHLFCCIDQLSLQYECLQEQHKQKQELEIDIRTLQMQKDLHSSIIELEKRIRAYEGYFENINIKEILEKWIIFLKMACSKIYLQNVLPFKTQQDYDNLETSFQSIADILRKIYCAIGNTSMFEVLLKIIIECQKLHDKLLNKEVANSELGNKVAACALKYMSSTLCSHHCIDKK